MRPSSAPRAATRLSADRLSAAVLSVITAASVCAVAAASLAACAFGGAPPPTPPPAARARTAAAASPAPAGGATRLPSPAPAPAPAPSELVYGHDGHPAQTCAGRTDALHYTVFRPSTPGPHPIVFGLEGSGFAGVAACDPNLGKDRYHSLDPIMSAWAEAGFVAVNIEYHGADDGLFGDLTYPGPGRWGTSADGTTELDVKPAIEHFLSEGAETFGGDERSGIVVFGASSGAHDAYMVGVTGLAGHRISAVIGWSGLPDAAHSGAYIESALDRYLRTQPGSDLEGFADPVRRLQAGDPPEYAANARSEFIDPAGARTFADRCRSLGIPACWLRVPDTNAHARQYAGYVFSRSAPEMASPPAIAGETVLADSIAFARALTS